MSTQVIYSLLTDLNSPPAIVNLGQLSTKITSMPSAPPLASIDVDAAADMLTVNFSSTPSVTQLTETTTAVHTYRHYQQQSSATYNAVVSANGDGDFKSIASAFAAGNSSVYVKSGVYYETANIVVPNGGLLKGESPGTVTVALVAGNSIVCDGSGGVTGDGGATGTVVSVIGKAVTGTGTNFTVAAANDFIVLSEKFYKIASIQSDTQLTLAFTFAGNQAQVAGAVFEFRKMYLGNRVENLIVSSPGGTGVKYTNVKNGMIAAVVTVGCVRGFLFDKCVDLSILTIASTESSTFPNIEFLNSDSIACGTMNSFGGGQEGLKISGTSKYIVVNVGSVSNNGGSGIVLSDTASHVTITNLFMSGNLTNGMTIGANASRVNIANCNFNKNGNHGLSVLGNRVKVANSFAIENIGNGIEIGGASSNHVTVVGSEMSSNGINGLEIKDSAIHNVVSSCVVDSNSGSGVVVSDTATNNIVSANNIDNNGAYGVTVASGCVNTLVSSNVIINNVTANILNDAGTSTVLSSNI